MTLQNNAATHETPQNESSADDFCADAERYKAASGFLSSLDPTAKCFTFQTFDDDKERKDPALAKVLNGTLEQHWEALEAYNAKGAGVFVTVNRTDGKGRKLSNITAVRSIWAEMDTEDVPEFPLKPSYVVNSSAGRSHFYWLVAGKMSADDFAALMATMVDRFG